MDPSSGPSPDRADMAVFGSHQAPPFGPPGDHGQCAPQFAPRQSGAIPGNSEVAGWEPQRLGLPRTPATPTRLTSSTTTQLAVITGSEDDRPLMLGWKSPCQALDEALR